MVSLRSSQTHARRAKGLADLALSVVLALVVDDTGPTTKVEPGEASIQPEVLAPQPLAVPSAELVELLTQLAPHAIQAEIALAESILKEGDLVLVEGVPSGAAELESTYPSASTRTTLHKRPGSTLVIRRA